MLLYNKINIAQIFSLLFLASLFFPIRYVFPSQAAFQTGAYSDFTSISLYLSDIFLFITWCFCFLPRGGNIWQLIVIRKSLMVFLIWLILATLWHFQTFSSLNLWFLVKFLELIVAYETFSYLFSKTRIKKLFFQLFVILCTFQSLLAIYQFLNQRSLGLGKLGEQVLLPNILGLAKIVSGETVLIRSYGTFPHPNLLSAFFVVGIIFSLYLLINSRLRRQKLLYSLVLFINSVGLCLTFSRAGYLAVAAGVLVMLGGIYYQTNTEQRVIVKKVLVLAFFVAITCFLLFKPYILSRATITDQASLERVFYSKVGLHIVADHPVFGVGIGESVLHMQQYSPVKLWPWQIQPVHNYPLLAAVEIGIPGALILLWFFLKHLWALFSKIRTQTDFQLYTFNFTLLSILMSFLVLMQFDHYFYTLQQTQMLLWVSLGIISAQTKTPSDEEAGEKL